jgi:S1-C subfamily serine protease
MHFLDEFARFGAFRGVAGRGFQWQKLENAALRGRHGVPADASGVLLARLDPLAPSSEALRARDILLNVEGVPIADDGTVAFRGAKRLEGDCLDSA